MKPSWLSIIPNYWFHSYGLLIININLQATYPRYTNEGLYGCVRKRNTTHEKRKETTYSAKKAVF